MNGSAPPSEVGERLDIEANRRARKYGSAEMWRRVLWMAAGPLFRFSPRPCFGWRNFLLRLFGARIGANVHIYASATIYHPWNLEVGEWSSIGEHVFLYNLGKVTIGRQVTLSLGARICAGTHDYTRPDMPLLRPPVTVCDRAWICAEAFVGPGVTVGEGAVIAARAVVMSDVERWMVAAGNPAVAVKKRMMAGESTGGSGT